MYIKGRLVLIDIYYRKHASGYSFREGKHRFHDGRVRFRGGQEERFRRGLNYRNFASGGRGPRARPWVVG